MQSYVVCVYITIAISINQSLRREAKRWFVGRVPPNQYFEYSSLNGFFYPKNAKQICETDFQCAGFTFKGTRRISNVAPEVYFFHFINETAEYLTTNVMYPHWTTYIVGSRNYISIIGAYQTDTCRTTNIPSK